MTLIGLKQDEMTPTPQIASSASSGYWKRRCPKLKYHLRSTYEPLRPQPS